MPDPTLRRLRDRLKLILLLGATGGLVLSVGHCFRAVAAEFDVPQLRAEVAKRDSAQDVRMDGHIARGDERWDSIQVQIRELRAQLTDVQHQTGMVIDNQQIAVRILCDIALGHTTRVAGMKCPQ